MSNDNTTEDGSTTFRLITGGKTTEGPPQPALPQNAYVVVDINGDEHFHEGFLVFTSQHVAIMRDTPTGGLPVFLMPLDKVFAVEFLEDDPDEVFDNEPLVL